MAKKKSTKVANTLSKLCKHTSNDMSKLIDEETNIVDEIRHHLLALGKYIANRYASAITDYLYLLTNTDEIQIEFKPFFITIDAWESTAGGDDHAYGLRIKISNNGRTLISCTSWTGNFNGEVCDESNTIDEFLSIFPVIRYLNEQFDAYIENKIKTECTELLNKNAAYRTTIQNIRKEIGQYTMKLKNRELEYTIDANLQ